MGNGDCEHDLVYFRNRIAKILELFDPNTTRCADPSEVRELVRSLKIEMDEYVRSQSVPQAVFKARNHLPKLSTRPDQKWFARLYEAKADLDIALCRTQ